MISGFRGTQFPLWPLSGASSSEYFLHTATQLVTSWNISFGKKWRWIVFIIFKWMEIISILSSFRTSLVEEKKTHLGIRGQMNITEGPLIKVKWTKTAQKYSKITCFTVVQQSKTYSVFLTKHNKDISVLFVQLMLGGFTCYLRWQCMCLCSSSSWLCKQRQQWQRGGAASRTAHGPCTVLWCHDHRYSWHGKGWQRQRPLQYKSKSSPSQTWGHINQTFRNMM